MLMTGVAKFTKLSIFSSLNSPSDLTFNPDYAAMLGYTDEELEANFSEHMHARADAMGLSYKDYRAELKRWYNGYRFTRDEIKVYNPISIAESLKSKSPHMTADWSATGRPSMLATFLKAHDITSMPFEKGIPADISELETSSDFSTLKPKAMLYQTGYLTMIQADPGSDSIVLGFPDEEIRRDMYRFISDLRANDENWCKEALNYLKIGDIDEFLTRLTALYAGLPTGAKVKRLPESHYQGILQTALLSAGFICSSECVQSSRKRCDTVVETPNNICIFELKVGKRLSAKTAVQQILERDYAAPHLGKGKPVFAVGLIFHPEDHTLRDSAWQEVTR